MVLSMCFCCGAFPRNSITGPSVIEKAESFYNAKEITVLRSVLSDVLSCVWSHGRWMKGILL